MIFLESLWCIFQSYGKLFSTQFSGSLYLKFDIERCSKLHIKSDKVANKSYHLWDACQYNRLKCWEFSHCTWREILTVCIENNKQPVTFCRFHVKTDFWQNCFPWEADADSFSSRASGCVLLERKEECSLICLLIYCQYSFWLPDTYYYFHCPQFCKHFANELKTLKTFHFYHM